MTTPHTSPVTLCLAKQEEKKERNIALHKRKKVQQHNLGLTKAILQI
jgi:hypothetical protein